MAIIAKITRLAFDKTNGQEVEMIARIRASPRFIPELSLVAEVEGQPAGHLFISCEALRYSDRQPTDAVPMLGPISVLPAFQRRGIDGALIQRGLNLCHSHSEPLVTLFGHSDHYSRYGFHFARKFGILPA